jgi:hypothetical protein
MVTGSGTLEGTRFAMVWHDDQENPMKFAKAIALIGIGLLVGKAVKNRVTASAPAPKSDDFQDTMPSAYPLDAAEPRPAKPPIH